VCRVCINEMFILFNIIIKVCLIYLPNNNLNYAVHLLAWIIIKESRFNSFNQCILSQKWRINSLKDIAESLQQKYFRHLKTTRLLYCKLSNSLFCDNSCVIIVSDHPFYFYFKPTASGPSFLDKFHEQTSEPGPSISLKCAASGHPIPQVTWLLDGLPVPDNSRFRTGDYVTRDSVVVSYVNISSLTTQDGGLYVSNTRIIT